jgi:hypothetical protein
LRPKYERQSGLVTGGPRGPDSDFAKIGTISVLPSFAVKNDVETGKNCKCAAILIVFRRNPGVV